MKARHLRRFSLAAIGLLSLGAAGACNGRIGSNSNTGQSTGNGTGGSGAQTASGAGGAGNGSVTGTGGDAPNPNNVPIVTKGTPPAESAGVLSMRRLTYQEYDHMLADLLGDTTAPAEAGGWPPDPPNTVDYVAPNSVADLQVEHYNGTANKIVDKAIQAAVAGTAAGKLTIPCKNPSGSSAETTCATQFVTTFGQQVYRRPVATAEQTDLLEVFSTVRGLGLSFTDSIGAMVKAMIQSPNFLYHWEIGPTAPRPGSDGLVALTPWQVASRLASVLWQTMPDDTLIQAAQSGQLSTPAQVAAQVTRMLGDARATNGLYSFHEQWLFNFGNVPRDLTVPLDKSSPMFTNSVNSGLQTEFAKFVSSVYAGDGTLQALFTAPYAYVNKDLAAIYGVPAPSTDFDKVSLDPAKRGGIFTQVAFLATMAADTRDQPIYRGVGIYLKVLCGEMDFSKLPAVLPAVNFTDNGTTRQSFDAHGMATCAKGCHNLFDPPGFAFENYDGIGQYRTTEAGQNVDSTGSFTTPGGATLTFQNALDLSKQLAQSSEAQTCIDRQWTRYLLGREETTAESGSMSVAYQNAAATSGFSIRDLLMSLVTSKAFLYRQPSQGEAL